MNKNFYRILSIIGSSIAVAFGILHFFMPYFFGWFEYIKELPYEVLNLLMATNLFVSIAIIFAGLLSIYFTITQWENRKVLLPVLWPMSIFCIIKVIYQIISPHGKNTNFIPYLILIFFIILTLCFLLPAIKLSFFEKKLS